MVPASKTAAGTCLKPSQPLTPKPRISPPRINVFQAGNGEFGVLPSAEYDGDSAAIVHEFDPFQP